MMRIALWLGIAITTATCSLEHGHDVAASADLVFTNANVVTMESEAVLLNQSVFVSDGRITAIKLTEAIPEGPEIVDAGGGYLVPGLADMHVHFSNSDHLRLFVFNGVTTIRNMSGNPSHIRFREEVASGQLVGPTIITASPHIDGNPPVWPNSSVVESSEQADSIVAEQQAAGYDFLKLYQNLNEEAYEALATSAQKRGLRFAGHTPDAVGLETVIHSGQWSIEHLSGFWEALLRSEDPEAWDDRDRTLRVAVLGARMRQVREGEILAAEAFDSNELIRLAQIMRDNDVWVVPTNVLYNGVSSATLGAARQDPNLAYMDPLTKMTWARMFGGRSPARGESVLSLQEVMRTWIRVLSDEGVNITLGTDAMNPFVMPGFSVHDELALMVHAGLSPYQAIATSTIEAARFLGQDNEFGTINLGKRADMVLVSDNPLEDIGHLRDIRGVLVRGRWIPKDEIDHEYQTLAARYQKQNELIRASLSGDVGSLLTHLDETQSEPTFNNDQLGQVVGMLLGTAQPQAGLKVAEHMVQSSPDEGLSFFMLGEAHRANSNLEAAVEAQRAVVDLDPTSREMKFRLEMLERQLDSGTP